MALGTSYKTVLWKRRCREISIVENEGSTLHRPVAKLCVLEEATK